ncbi:MAG: hypothetical protein KGY56_10015 [Desulfobacterales bacterium]|nr:hypothetical protein [Desulfobacterales bacterium]
MEEKTNNTADGWIEKLIRFFKHMPRKKPDAEQADYTGWHQSEAQYQKEQAEWQAQVAARRQKKRIGNGKEQK